jgi:drug/metabolite transporter (DMT)-like permease
VSAAALLLALAAAALHALWNLLLARARDAQAATAVVLLVSLVVWAAPAAATWRVEAAAVPWLVASALLETAYFALLAAAYAASELSLVYPVARGLAPLLVLAAAGAASVVQGVGVAVVAAGVLLVRGATRHGDRRGLALAVGVAACIAAYTIVDKHGIRHASAIAYLELVSLGPCLLYPAYVVRRRGLAAVKRELGPATLAAGVVVFAAYVLVLAALRLAPAAPVAAVRESSVVIATALGALVLGERVGRMRLAGAVLVAAGVSLVAI